MKNGFLKKNWKNLLIWSSISCSIYFAIKYGIDKKIVVFGTVVIGVFTQAFAGLAAIAAAVPLIGPFLVKIFSIPFFYIVNAMSYFISAVAIRKGHGSDLTKSRVLTIAMMIGILIGYIIGNLAPVK